jgi:hypothetical protein
LLGPFRTVPFFVTCKSLADAARRSSIGSDALGVGNNPNPVPAVRCAKVGSWYAVPFRIIPERGQGSENVCKPSTKQCCDVFQDDISWCQFANQTGDFVEQTAALSGKPCALPCGADVLTWEPAADDIDGNSIGSKSLCGKGADIIVTGDIGPVLGEDFARERFDFAEGNGFKSACSFKAKAKPSDAREKIEDAELFHSPHPVFVRSITHTPAEERAKRLAVQVRGEVREAFAEGHAASPVWRACATTGDSIAASSAPCVTRSAASANSGGQGLSLSCVILPFETPIAAASWLRFIASGRLR